MIKVTFTDGTSTGYRIGAKRLGATRWHHVEYRASFKTIATIINKDVTTIESWKVV